MFFRLKKLISIDSFSLAYFAAMEMFNEEYWDRVTGDDKFIFRKGLQTAIALWLKRESYEDIKEGTYYTMESEFLYRELR